MIAIGGKGNESVSEVNEYIWLNNDWLTINLPPIFWLIKKLRHTRQDQ